jgi:hypothetical protein
VVPPVAEDVPPEPPLAVVEPPPLPVTPPEPLPPLPPSFPTPASVLAQAPAMSVGIAIKQHRTIHERIQLVLSLLGAARIRSAPVSILTDTGHRILIAVMVPPGGEG